MKCAIATLICLAPVLAYGASAATPILKLNSPADVPKLTLHNTDAAVEGQALRVNFRHVAWPNVFFAQGKAYEPLDWSAFGGLAIDVRNPGDEDVRVCIRVDDSPQADGRRNCRTGSAMVPPRAAATVVMPFGAATTDMRGGPPLDIQADNVIHMTSHGTKLDMSRIVAFQFFLPRPAGPRTLVLSNVRWMPKPDLVGMVDRFGQYARAEWPGKLHQEAEFAQRRAAEEQWLQDHPVPADRDRFGGWKNGPQLEASGYFRTALLVDGKETQPPASGYPVPKGKWWLVTPEGRLFFSIGVTCVRPESNGPVRKPREMYAWLPSAKTRRVDFYAWNLKLKYGEDPVPAWVDVTCRRLRSWGFTTIGNWSSDVVWRARKVPYTVPIHCKPPRSIWSKAGPEWLFSGRKAMPDVFHPDYAKTMDAAIAARTKEWKDDPWCIGYFVNNELPWGGYRPWGKEQHKVARQTLACDGTQPAKRAFVEQLRAKHGTVERFNQAWGLDAASWDALLEGQVALKPGQLTDAARQDCSEFLTLLAERYFTAVRAAMDRHAPKQLYLGCRFSNHPKEAVLAAERYCDVICFNRYRRVVNDESFAFTQGLCKPVIIGEFHFGATDRGMFHTGLGPTADQAARAEAYVRYVESVLAMPNIVGCHWFQYVDQCLTGRFDGENYNIGFVTVTDTPHPELRDAAVAINSKVYGVR